MFCFLRSQEKHHGALASWPGSPVPPRLLDLSDQLVKSAKGRDVQEAGVVPGEHLRCAGPGWGWGQLRAIPSPPACLGLT